jgi:aminoglycoside phosphotransferase family enzyme/predicted kinase
MEPVQDAALAAHRALVQSLMCPASWPEALPPGTRVECIETHISTLLLAGDSVLKLKKPLRLPFLDFSTADQRLHFCNEELRLNLRTAPAIYRAVLQVGSDHAPDWALWMRRFDNRLLFHVLARNGSLTDAHVDALAAVIAGFQARLAPSAPGLGAPQVALRWAAANLADLQDPALAAHLAPAARDQLAALARWSPDRGQALLPLMTARRASGAVVEGHGDLHLANIVLHDGRPLLFDAIEFNPELRHADRLADLSFPFMDLLDHGLPAPAWRLLCQALDLSGDHAGLPLLRWWAADRALVRAKVALIEAGQGVAGAAALAAQRIALAHDLAHPAPPRIVLTSGLSGSGKSTVALLLAQTLGALRVRSDVERKRLFGTADLARLYSPDSTARTYQHLSDIASAALDGGLSVVLDAAFLRRAEREAMQTLARRRGVAFHIVACSASPATLLARVQRRQAAGTDPSDADVAVLARQQHFRQVPQADEHATMLDTDCPLADLELRVQLAAQALTS